MKKLKRKKSNKGFTLIEILVVICIVGVVAAMSLFIDINSYRGDAFRSEINNLGIALQTARADALNNINQKKHGVAIFPADYSEGYVVFEGDNYANRDNSLDNKIKASYKTTLDASSPVEIVFDQLSGNALDGNVILLDPERNLTATISLNHEGEISW